MNIEEKLNTLGIKLPEAAAPVGAYIPAVRAGNQAFTSGQIPLVAGELRYKGKLGADVSIEEGYEAAKICAINALAALKGLLGDLNKVKKVIKVTGFVNSTPDFTAQAKVVNGASELLGQLFSEGHARSAVGTAALPIDAAVEVEMIVEIAD
ncbi:MAG: RidA family protein [Dethiobacter sp.]|nr:RidA family protein [Dethiobacter sp.]